jgi:hypothetical protein
LVRAKREIESKRERESKRETEKKTNKRIELYCIVISNKKCISFFFLSNKREDIICVVNNDLIINDY